MAVETIDDVIGELDDIIAYCQEENSRKGYFAALYRKVTVDVKSRISKNQFLDNERMEELDVIFAKRYIDAFRDYHDGRQASRAWVYSFEQAEDSDLIVLQHLLLGMNAHINLDLGVSAAELMTPEEMDSFEHDFDQINTVLAQLVDEVQDEVSHRSELLQFLDKIGGRIDEAVCSFGLAQARTAAWRRARELYAIPNPDMPARIDEYDIEVERFAHKITSVNGVFRPLLRVIRTSEENEDRQIRDIIEQLI